MKKRHYLAMIATLFLFSCCAVAVGFKVAYPDLTLEDWMSATVRNVDEHDFPRPNHPPVPIKRD